MTLASAESPSTAWNLAAGVVESARAARICDYQGQDANRDARFEVRNSAIHGGGAFATCALAAGERVGEYIGERISKAEAAVRCTAGNPFIFTLNRRWDLDGNVPENPARFLNHSCAPNCEAEQRRGRIWLVALRDIAAGEELTFNYGYDLAEYRDHPCRCGTPECVGFIVAPEFHAQIRQARTAAAASLAK